MVFAFPFRMVQTPRNMTERSVITGIGILSPNGIGKDEFRAAIRAGKSGVRRVEHLDLSDCNTKIAGFIDDEKIDPLWPDTKAKSRLDRAALFSLIASEMAVTDSGLDNLSELPVRKGIVLGTGCGMVGTNEAAYHRFYALQKHRAKPTTVPRAMYNAAACEIGIRHGLRRIASSYDPADAVDEGRQFLADRPYTPAAQANRTLVTHRSWS